MAVRACLATHFSASITLIIVTTCLENLEMPGNLTAVSEMSGILLKVREESRKKILSKKSCLKLFIVSCICIHTGI